MAAQIGRSYRVPKEDLEAFILANSTGPDVREALFPRVKEIVERNPKLSGDEMLEDLEQRDRERQSKRQAV